MDDSLKFEMSMRQFFGEKAERIAGQVSLSVEKKRWMRKVVKQMMKVVDGLDTTIYHKSRLLNILIDIEKDLKNKNMLINPLFFHLLGLCGTLMGFQRGNICYTLVYWQTAKQYYDEKVLQGEDAMLSYYDNKNFVNERQKIAKQLKAKGLNNFTIAMILNTSEYKVRQLIKI